MKSTCLASTVPSPPSPKGREGYSGAGASRCVRRLGDMSSAPTTGQRVWEGTGDSVFSSPSPQPSPQGRGGYSGAAVHETSGLLSNRPPLPEGEGLGVRGKTGHWEPTGSRRPSWAHYTEGFLTLPISPPGRTGNE